MKKTSKKKRKLNSKNKILEKNWDERFILDRIPVYDAYNDINYLSLGLVRSKIKFEEKRLKEFNKKHKKIRASTSPNTIQIKRKKKFIFSFAYFF